VEVAMKITFVVPILNLTGGLRVVSIYAKLLSEKGHQVTVVSPNKKTPNLKQKIKLALHWKGFSFKSKFNSSFFDEAVYEVRVLDTHRPVTKNDVPDADIIIATFWNTAEWLATFPENKGRKIYFIQHHEVHSWLPVERVKATFKLPLQKIVVAQWIADIMRDDYQQQLVTTITNAVDHKLFYAAERLKNTQTTFGMMYSGRSYKGSQLAFECFEKLQKEYSAIKLLVFGLESVEHVVGLPAGAEYCCQPEQDAIRDIYSQCDAWLFTSSSEGFGLPILEAMACRTPVIGTRCGAAPDLLKSGGGVLIDINDGHALLSAMTKFYFMSDDEWLLMSDLAYKEAILHNWEDKADQFEQGLLSSY